MSDSTPFSTSSTSSSALTVDASAGSPQASSPPRNLEQVKLLFDYTKFHIGLYTTLATLLLAVAGSSFAKSWKVDPHLVTWAVGAIVLAGWAGGVVASSLPYHLGEKDVYDAPTGPLFLNYVPIRLWTYLEHLSFWAAIALIIAAFWQPIRYGPINHADGQASPCSVTIKGCEGVILKK